MAVYTQLNQSKIEEILSNYNLGKLDSFRGIEEGIENTNYFLLVNKKKLILTIGAGHLKFALFKDDIKLEKKGRSSDLTLFS